MFRRFKKKWPHRSINEFSLHHDNAKLHVAHTVVEFLDRHGIKSVPHLPYSPELAPVVKIQDEQGGGKRYKELAEHGLKFLSVY